MEAVAEKLKVKDWMTLYPETLTEGDLVRRAVEIFDSKQIRHIPIVRGDDLVGMLTDRDIKTAAPAPGLGTISPEYEEFLDQTLLGEVMTPGPITCTPETDLVEIVDSFVDYRFGAIPVVRGNRLVGIITQVDVMRAGQKFLREMI